MFFMFCMTWGVLPTQLEVGCGFIRWTSEILNYLAHYLAHAKLQRPMSIIYIYIMGCSTFTHTPGKHLSSVEPVDEALHHG